MSSIFGYNQPNQNLDTNDSPEFAGLTINGDEVLTEAGDQNVDITLTTSQTIFTQDQELITKKYVDTTSGIGTLQLVYDASNPSAEIIFTQVKPITFKDEFNNIALTISTDGINAGFGGQTGGIYNFRVNKLNLAYISGNPVDDNIIFEQNYPFLLTRTIFTENQEIITKKYVDDSINNITIPSLNNDTRTFEISPVGARDKWVATGSINAAAGLSYWGGNIMLSYGNEPWVSYSLDYGTTWTLCTIIGTPLIDLTSKAMYNPNTNTYLFIEYTSQNIYTSNNGITFTYFGVYPYNIGDDTTYFNNLYIVSNVGVNNIATSPDGITWTLRTASQTVYNFCIGLDENDVSILCTHGQNTGPMYSYDGIIWTNAAGPVNSGRAICYSNNRHEFIIIASNGDVHKSINGRNYIYLSNIGSYGTANVMIYVNNDSYGKAINMYYIPITDVNNNFGLAYSPTMEPESIRTNLLEGATLGNQGIYSLLYVSNRMIIGNNLPPYINYTTETEMAFTNGISFIPYPKVAGGLSTEFLKANGTIDNSIYITSSALNDLNTKTQNIDISTTTGITYLNGNLITNNPDIANIGNNAFRFNTFFNDTNYKGISTYLTNSRILGNLLPQTTLTNSFGNSLLRWNEIFTGSTNTDTITINTSLSCPLITSNVSIGGNLTPAANNNFDLGSLALQFNNIYSNNIIVNNLSTTAALPYQIYTKNNGIYNSLQISFDMNATTTLLSSYGNLEFRWNGAQKQPQWRVINGSQGFSYSTSIRFIPSTNIFICTAITTTTNTWQYFTATGAVNTSYNATLNGGRYEISVMNNTNNTVGIDANIIYSVSNSWGKTNINCIN